jgi:hypothetical protein
LPRGRAENLVSLFHTKELEVKKQLATLMLGLSLVGGLATVPVFGQADGGNGGAQGGGGGGGGRGRGNFDPAQWRQQMEQRMKDEMKVSDDEWKVLQPKIQKVQQLQFATRAGGFGRNRGGNGGGGDRPASPVATASQDLRNTLDDKAATDEQIKAKLAALREAKTKAKEELAKAQSELREVVSVRQEAVLVRDGLLD